MKILLLILFFVMTALEADTVNYVVVVNKSNHLESLSRTKLGFIYARKVSRWPWGAEVKPVDLDERSPIRKQFTKVVLRSSIDQIKVYWIDQKVSSNLEPPMEMKSPKAVREFVATHPGAIAYIPPDYVDDSVKVLGVE